MSRKIILVRELDYVYCPDGDWIFKHSGGRLYDQNEILELTISDEVFLELDKLTKKAMDNE